MITYETKVPVVLGKVASFADLLMGTMAAQIEVQIKTSGNTPIEKGNLRSSARSVRIAPAIYEVVDTAAYAAAQEVGYRHTKTGKLVEFINHPRGGGKEYFKKAVETVSSRSPEYISTAQKAVGLERTI